MLDPKRLVQDGYDRIAERYAEWSSRTGVEVQARYVAVVLGALPHGADILDLGCGPGGTATRAQAARFRLTGVDISDRCISMARAVIPHAQFHQGDMTQLDFPPATWDAIVAFYSILHVPRDEHAALFGKLAVWLRPGGLFVASFGARNSEAGYEANWLGTPMYWSGFEAGVERHLLEASGFQIERAVIETIDEDGQPTPFLWVIARRATARSVIMNR